MRTENVRRKLILSSIIIYSLLADGFLHTGDNRTGEGEGDDEQLVVDLKKVPADVHKIAITVTIYDAEGRSQNFGQVGNAFVRLANEETNEEVLRFDLGKISPSKQQLSFVNYTVIMDSGSLMQ